MLLIRVPIEILALHTYSYVLHASFCMKSRRQKEAHLEQLCIIRHREPQGPVCARPLLLLRHWLPPPAWPIRPPFTCQST